MWLSKFGLKSGITRSSSSFTITMVICPTY
ncbi:hypothetical protein Golob_027594 [Gossypium lobatum]|uniref:Uncharacterized protein n=1 Tax=Gossypium lobatum TaxID=34289 RepID=A0A7J8NDD9_9ROSI|nr:hypothetical protein [Gossypium lobatum]